MLSQLACLGRHTLTGVICASGGQFKDWSADYRLFSRERFDQDAVFSVLREEAVGHLADRGPIVCAMDDSVMRKKGLKIPGTGRIRDPMSPPFHVNLAWAQRFLQVSVIVPSQKREAPARAVPVDFAHAPLTRKPRVTSPPELWERYRELKEQNNVSKLGVGRIKKFRWDLDRDERTARRELWVVVDGRFTNKRVFDELPLKTVLIGRLRADSRLFYPPRPEDKAGGAGRKRSYGRRAPTPEELRRDESIPWQRVRAFAAGRVHHFKVKVLSGVLWKPAGAKRPLLLVVIAPLSYRPTKRSAILYRNPAYLVCTDVEAPVDRVIQAYVWRWEIEVNIRDEKQLMGLGEAQVRNENSVEKDPALVIAAYAMLLLAGLAAFPNERSSLPPPKWRRRKKPRASTQDLVNQLRFELWGKAMGVESPLEDENRGAEGDFEGFTNTASINQKPKKSTPDLRSAVLYATA